MSLILAPWTDEQVEALNSWQACNWVHPFTCGERNGRRHRMVRWLHGFIYSLRELDEMDALTATRFGWVCPFCSYTQNWAHDFMLKLPENILVDWDYQDRNKEKE